MYKHYIDNDLYPGDRVEVYKDNIPWYAGYVVIEEDLFEKYNNAIPIEIKGLCNTFSKNSRGHIAIAFPKEDKIKVLSRQWNSYRRLDTMPGDKIKIIFNIQHPINSKPTILKTPVVEVLDPLTAINPNTPDYISDLKDDKFLNGNDGIFIRGYDIIYKAPDKNISHIEYEYKTPNRTLPPESSSYSKYLKEINNSATCPICGSTGKDLAFAFYCSNRQCINYRK